jgi:hypothetical protein
MGDALPLTIALMAGMLALNYFIWKSRGRGWRKHVDAFIRTIQPRIPEPVRDVIVMEPAGWVGRQARGEQMRGLNVLLSGMGGELQGALAQHRATEAAEAEDELPPWTALVLTDTHRYLMPVRLEDGKWSAGEVEKRWKRGETRLDTSARTLTVRVHLSLADGSWQGEYEIARDPAKYGIRVLDTLRAQG